LIVARRLNLNCGAAAEDGRAAATEPRASNVDTAANLNHPVKQTPSIPSSDESCRRQSTYVLSSFCQAWYILGRAHHRGSPPTAHFTNHLLGGSSSFCNRASRSH
jgi:hypothetical protein